MNIIKNYINNNTFYLERGKHMNKVVIDGNNLTLKQIVDVTRNNYFVELSEEAKARV